MATGHPPLCLGKGAKGRRERRTEPHLVENPLSFSRTAAAHAFAPRCRLEPFHPKEKGWPEVTREPRDRAFPAVGFGSARSAGIGSTPLPKEERGDVSACAKGRAEFDRFGE